MIANIPILIPIYNQFNALPVVIAIIKSANINNPVPTNNANITRRIGDIFPLERKEMRLINTKHNAVMPKAIPIVDQLTTIVSIEKAVPTNTEYIIPGIKILCLPRNITKLMIKLSMSSAAKETAVMITNIWLI